ncbi:unnamed protein product [Didymodactylos carnosus]|uniref:Uncharacterized protein n=1 Tax=Didymodactylos carnosus TaxID=1234261 RepID=A0A815YKU5_9BILA|nr:unnamed protein product [Didymodactylos carnosus]CAF4435539.1 unnamed protein product [Didymodactylos carnosus]
MMTKMYVMQKRASDISKVVNNVNLMTLPGKTASRYVLSAARIVLTDEQYTNGYLPDFRGDKSGRVPIPQESVDKLRAAVRKRFGFNQRWAAPTPSGSTSTFAYLPKEKKNIDYRAI